MLPPEQPARLVAPRRTQCLDTHPEPAFDDLTRLAASICGTPVSLVSLVDADRTWFKSRFGLEATVTPRGWAFCGHAIHRPDLFVVPDATADGRFAADPFVVGEPHIRFYAGMPLVTPDGHAVGTLCVIDFTPRHLTADQRDALRVLARQVVAQVVLREQVARQAKESETFRVLFEESSDAHLLFDERDGIIDCNHAAVAMLRLRRKEEVLALHPAVLSPEFQPCGRRSLDKCIDMDATARRDGRHRFDWTHRRADGEQFPCEVTLTPVELHGRSVLLVVWHDLTERKRAEDALRASEERFRAAMEGSLDAVYFLAAERDAGGRITDFRFTALNRRGAQLVGRASEDVIGRRLCDMLPVNRTGGFFDKYVRVVETGQPLEEEFAITAAGITAGWLHHQVVKAGDGVAITSQDVTAGKRAELELRASEERFDLAVRGSQDGLWDWDLRTGVVYYSPKWKEMLGYAEDEVAGHVGEWRRLTHPDDLPRAEAALTAYFTHAAPRYGLEVRMRHKDGTYRWVFTRGMALFAADGTPVRMAGSHTDVTAVKRVEEELRQSEQQLLDYQRELEAANAQLHALATTDRLTGVKNRGAFNDRLAEEFDRAVRHGHPLSVVLLDVDHFKPFNDTFGHPAGDAVLRAVAGLLQQTVRGADVVARYGGEEFVVLLPDTDYAGAMALAERLRRAVAGASWDQRAITVSVGVGTLDPTTPDAAALVKEADDALYCSKRAGRNKVSYGSGTVPMPALRT